MDKRTALILIVALSCPSRSVAQSGRNYDDTGAPPFKVLKEAGDGSARLRPRPSSSPSLAHVGPDHDWRQLKRKLFHNR